MAIADPILLTAVRFTTADLVLRIDSGTAQDITVPVNTDTDYWFSGDAEGRANRADLARLLQDALNLNTDGETFTVTISDRNVLTVAATAAFQLLWDHTNTTLPKAVFGFTGDTSSSTSTAAPDAAQGCWVPSVADTNVRPPRRDRRPQPITRGVVAATISGRSRAYNLAGSSSLGERSLSWHLLHRSKVLTEFAPAAAPYGALEWWWVDGGALNRPIRYYADKTDRTAYWLGRSKQIARPWAEDESQPLVRYLVDLEMRAASEPADVTALDALDYWHAAYSAEDITGAGPYTWAPYEGTGPTLTHNVAFTSGVSTSPMLAAGLGSGRVNQAFTPGTESFRNTGLNNWPAAGPVHVRCVFRPNSESVGYLWTYLVSGTELFQARFSGSTTLALTWRHDSDGALYTGNVTVTDGDWHLLDVLVDPTGGSGGNTAMTVYLNGSDVSLADHSAAISVARAGQLGLGAQHTGTGPMAGDFLWWGVRGGTISLAAHTAHAGALGV